MRAPARRAKGRPPGHARYGPNTGPKLAGPRARIALPAALKFGRGTFFSGNAEPASVHFPDNG